MSNDANESHWSPAAAAASGWHRRASGRRAASTWRSTACARNRRVADVVAGSASKLGATSLYCQGDVAEAADRQRMIDRGPARFGRLDVLVNNAGVAPTCGPTSSSDRGSELRPPDPHQPQGPVLPHAARRPLDGRTARSRRRIPRRDRQHLVGRRPRSLAQPRRLLHQQGRRPRWPRSSGPPGWPRSASPSTNSARRHPHRHDGPRHRKVRPADRRRPDRGEPLGRSRKTSAAPSPCWSAANSPMPPARC